MDSGRQEEKEYSSKKMEISDPRREPRMKTQKGCILSNGFGIVAAEATDISQKGIGILISGKAPFEKGTSLFVQRKNNANKYKAHVAWVKELSKVLSKAGMRYEAEQ